MNLYKLKLTSILSLFGVILIISFFYVDSYFFKKDTKELFFEKTKEKILKKEEIFKSFFKDIDNHLFAISKSRVFQNFLDSRDNKSEVEELFLTFAKANSIFMQLRFIDRNGNEIIRVDRTHENRAFIVKEDKLQNKKHRYYFEKILNSNTIWYSKIDLNMEYNKLEIPYKPTMRIGMPIKVKDKIEGILIFNFFMKDFLNTFVENSNYDSYLIDKNGYFLFHPNSKYNWSLYLNKNYTIKDEFPNIYEEILKNGLFYSDKIFSKKIDFHNEDGLILILKSKTDSFQEYILNHKENILFILIIIVIFSIPIAYIFSLYPTKLHSELEVQKQDYKTMIDSLPLMVFYKDKFNNIIKMNKLAKEFLKIEDKFEKISIDTIFPDKEDECFDEDLKVMKSKKAKVGIIRSYQMENREFTLKVSKFPIIKDEKVGGLLVIAKDLTDELKLKEESIKKDKALIQQSKMAEVGAMIDVIAHQWKQPLNAVSILIEDLEQAMEFKELDEEYMGNSMKEIIKNVDFMAHTIDDFRYFFKSIESKRVFSLKDEIEKVADIFKPELRLYSTTLKIDKNENLNDKIDGYPNEFKQVILNLISNSKDAIVEQIKRKSIKEGFILISIEEVDSKLIVKFKDNGGGIDKNILPKIFELNSSTKGEKGSGVGLYISKIIVENKMGGEIKAKNIENGSEFSISLKKRINLS